MENIIFNIDSHQNLVKKLAKLLNMEVGKVKTTYFCDGEVMSKSLSDVKNKNVFIVQSSDKPAIEHIFKILLLIDSVKHAGAKNIYLFMPYFGFSRQERISWTNEPNSCQVVARCLSTSGIKSLYSIDLHHPIIYSFFDVPVIDIHPHEIFKNYYLNYFLKNNISLDDVCVVAPDHGANQRAHQLSDALNLKNEVVILTKHRPKANNCEILAIDGEVKDKYCIIIDDIIDTGKTIYNASKMLIENGAKKIFVGASHPVLSKGYSKYLHNKYIEDVVFLNTINKKMPSWISILDITPILVENIQGLIG